MEKNNYAYIAIVAIVAVVALVVLMSGKGAVKEASPVVFTADDNGNLGGQAMKSGIVQTNEKIEPESYIGYITEACFAICKNQYQDCLNGCGGNPVCTNTCGIIESRCIVSCYIGSFAMWDELNIPKTTSPTSFFSDYEERMNKITESVEEAKITEGDAIVPNCHGMCSTGWNSCLDGCGDPSFSPGYTFCTNMCMLTYDECTLSCWLINAVY